MSMEARKVCRVRDLTAHIVLALDHKVFPPLHQSNSFGEEVLSCGRLC